MAVAIRDAAAALGGEIVGRDRITAPGPGHSRADRSLSIVLSPSAPDGFVVTSFSGDDWRVCRDHVRERLGIAGGAGARERTESIRTSPAPVARDDAARTQRALDIWNAARAPEGSPIEPYLSGRGLQLPPEAAGAALRWHPDCPFGKGTTAGAMVALVRDVTTNAPRAIHRTAIDGRGRKRSDLGANGRLTLGPIAGGAVKLTPDDGVTLALGIGEGIESSLSLRALPEFAGGPVWALLAANQLARFPLLGGIESLWVAVDRDPTGVEAAAEVAARWRSREVLRVTPRGERQDLNDLVAPRIVDACGVAC